MQPAHWVSHLSRDEAAAKVGYPHFCPTHLRASLPGKRLPLVEIASAWAIVGDSGKRGAGLAALA